MRMESSLVESMHPDCGGTRQTPRGSAPPNGATTYVPACNGPSWKAGDAAGLSDGVGVGVSAGVGAAAAARLAEAGVPLAIPCPDAQPVARNTATSTAAANELFMFISILRVRDSTAVHSIDAGRHGEVWLRSCFRWRPNHRAPGGIWTPDSTDRPATSRQASATIDDPRVTWMR